jgi:hypothetical protein
MKCAIPLKGGDAGRCQYEYFALIWGAIENVSQITCKDHVREVTGRAHELCGGKFFRFLVPAGRH